jgi:hypothetical protein
MLITPRFTLRQHRDARQQQRPLSRIHRNRPSRIPSRGRRRQREGSPRQTLGAHPETIAIPQQHFQPRPILADKHERITTVRIVAQLARHHPSKRIKRTPHIGHRTRQVHTPNRKRDHANASTTARNTTGSKPASTATRTPSRRRSSNPHPWAARSSSTKPEPTDDRASATDLQYVNFHAAMPLARQNAAGDWPLDFQESTNAHPSARVR